MKKFLLMFAAAASLTACLDVGAPQASDPATETFAPSLGVNISQMQRTASGTYYRDIKLGTGASFNALTASSITVDFFGYLKDATRFGADTNSTIPLNSGLIYGFVDGIQGMQAGGERLIVIPSELGYGNSSTGPIPANATLIFDITLRAFQ
jgi:FKBP-type peptidyl-prolyl cis-trans isomerase